MKHQILVFDATQVPFHVVARFDPTKPYNKLYIRRTLDGRPPVEVIECEIGANGISCKNCGAPVTGPRCEYCGGSPYLVRR